MRTLLALLLLWLPISGCGSDSPERTPPTPETRTLAEGVLRQAIADSVALARTRFEASGAMTTEIREDDARVAVEDRFLLRHADTGTTITEPVSHTIVGDTSLLKDLYTFEDPKGNIRKQESRELAGLAFGADFSTILRETLDSGGSASLRLEPGDTAIEGTRCHRFTFDSEAGAGAFWVAVDSLDLRRLEISRDTDYLIGSYLYRLAADFRRPIAGLLLPVRMRTEFEYRRLFARGTGSIVVELSRAPAPADGAPPSWRHP